jgi:hypothetical protein
MPANAVKTSFWLPEDLLWQAKEAAAREHMTLRAWLTQLVAREFRRGRAA